MQRLFSKISGAISDFRWIFSREIVVYYWRGANDSNFGDQLNIDLFRYFKYKPIHSNPENSEVFAIGSVLHHYIDGYDGIVIGSGYIKPPASPRKTLGKTLALRGPGSNSYEEEKNIPLCDPGILVKRIFGTPEKVYKIGVVPHFRDRNDLNLKDLLENNEDVKCIDVLQKPAIVVKEIAQCEIILSSSLHGLVVADSYNIPAVWINFADRQEGGCFKFFDHHQSLGIERKRIDIVSNSNLDSILSFSITAPQNITDAKVKEMESVFYRLRYHLILLRVKRVLKKIKRNLKFGG